MTDTSSLAWAQLVLPSPLSFDAARAAIGALATISGQPLLVLEATGYQERVSWRLGCAGRYQRRVLAALQAQLPGLRWGTPSPTDNRTPAVVASAAVRFRGGAAQALDAQAVEPAIRGLLGALSGARARDIVHVQLVLGPRSRPRWPAHDVQKVSADRQRVEAQKRREHGFACEVRIAAGATDPAHARSLIEAAIAPLRQLEVPGVRVQLMRGSVRAFTGRRSPLFWPNRLTLSEVVPLTAWPVAAKTAAALPGVPSSHPRLLPATAAVAREGRILGEATATIRSETHSAQRSVAVTVEDSLRHLHLIGPTGVGKSTLMATLALQDIAAGHGVVVIDPKGDLVDDLCQRIAPDRLDDVVVLDARDEAPVGINGLAGAADPDLAADVLLGVFHSLYADAWGPRTHDVLHASLLTLARRGDASVAMIPLLLTNPGVRRSLIGRVVRDDPRSSPRMWCSG